MKTGVYIPEDLARTVDALARRETRSKSNMIRVLLEEALRNRPPATAARETPAAYDARPKGRAP